MQNVTTECSIVKGIRIVLLTRKHPRRMFILTTLFVFRKVYDLKPSTIFPSFRKDSSPLVCSLFSKFSYACSHLDSPSLCKRCHPQLFYPSHNLGFFLQDTLLQSGHVYVLILVNSVFEVKRNSGVTTECFLMEIDIKFFY